MKKIERPINTIETSSGWIGLTGQLGDDAHIVNVARTSFDKEIKEMSEKDVKLLNYLIKNRHESPMEFVQFQFLASAPLFVHCQWVKHRISSMNSQSRRYTEEDIEFYCPDEFRTQSKDNKQASNDDSINPLLSGGRYASDMIKRHCDISMIIYQSLLEAGICREQARMVLPQNMMVKFRWSVNLRSLLNFLSLRDDGHAQKEIQEFAQAIWLLIKPYVPEVIKAIKGE